MTKTMERVEKDEDRQAKSLEELEQGAAAIAERKKEAAGMSLSFQDVNELTIQRRSESRVKQLERVYLKPIWIPIGICELIASTRSIS